MISISLRCFSGSVGGVSAYAALDGPDEPFDDLPHVVRRDFRGHADGDAFRPVHQEIRERHRQHGRFLCRLVVVRDEVDGLLVEIRHHLVAERLEPRLGVAHGRRRIAVDGTEVSLAIHQRGAHVEVLRQADERVVNGGVAVGMVIPHHLADDLRALAIAARRRQPHRLHAVEDPAMRRLETVANVGERAPDDYAHGVIHVRAAHFVFDVDGDAIRIRCGHAVLPGLSPGLRNRGPSRLRSRGSDALGTRHVCSADVRVSDVEIADVECVVFDELAPRLDLITHQRREHLIGLGVILGADLQQRPVLRIHRRRPQGIRVHFAETLVAIDRDALAAGIDEEVDEGIDAIQRDVGFLTPCRRNCGSRLILGSRLRGQRRDFVDGTAANRRRIGRGGRLVFRQHLVTSRGAGVDDHRKPQILDLAVCGGKGAELTRADEVETDVIPPRVALRAIVNLELEDVVLVVARHRDGARRRRHARRNDVQTLALFEVRPIARVVLEKGGNHFRRVSAPGDQLQQFAIRGGALQIALERLAKELGAIGHPHDPRLDGAPHQKALELPLVLDVGLRPPSFRAEQRRLRDVDMPAIDQRPHLSVKEREEQGADVRAVDIGVGHDDDAVIAQLVGIEILAADAAPELLQNKSSA